MAPGRCAVALPFRPRLRRLAFPGRLGEWLASVDLARMEWLATHAEELQANPARRGRSVRLLAWGTWLFVGALEAWTPVTQGHSSPGLERDAHRLEALGAQWLRENAIADAAFDRKTGSFRAIFDRELKSHGDWAFLTVAIARAERHSGPGGPFLDGPTLTDLARLDRVEDRATPERYRFVSPELEAR